MFVLNSKTNCLPAVVLLADVIDIVRRQMGWKDLAADLAPDMIGSEMFEVEAAHPLDAGGLDSEPVNLSPA